MSNELEKLSVLNSMIRPRSVYLTSESLPEDADATSAIYQLSEPVIAKDGFDLVYGVRAFGFNASATNISQKQRNNRLQITLEMSPPDFIPVYNSSGYTFLPNSTQTQTIITYEVVFPSGLYSIEDLFAMLSNSMNYNIPSGYMFDITSEEEMVHYDGTLVRNKIPFTLNFSVCDGGFTLKPSIDGSILSYYREVEDDGSYGYYYSARSVNSYLHTVIIEPVKEAPDLYNLLFKNINSHSPQHTAITPEFELNIFGLNPPNSILFTLTNDLSGGLGGSTVPPTGSTVINIMDTLLFRVETLPDRGILHELARKYPALGFDDVNRGYRSYFLPNITPLYVEVQTDLETTNISSNGSRGGILVRQFLLGGGNGGTSFFQNYDTPIWMKMSTAREYLDSMKVIFQSEGNRWDFFNMNFFLELVFFEIAKQDINANELQGPNSDGLRLPPNDEITMAMGTEAHNPFPFRQLRPGGGVAYFKNPRGAELKRPRL